MTAAAMTTTSPTRTRMGKTALASKQVATTSCAEKDEEGEQDEKHDEDEERDETKNPPNSPTSK